MGKRKSSSAPKKPASKKQASLDKVFACLLCNNEKAVEGYILRKEWYGQLGCKVCGVKFQSMINYLSESVDVYSDWIDACEAAARNEAKKSLARGSSQEEIDDDCC